MSDYDSRIPGRDPAGHYDTSRCAEAASPDTGSERKPATRADVAHSEGAMPLALAPEQPVELRANETKIATLMCTPRDLEDLGWGHLASRSIAPAIPIGLAEGCLPRPAIRVCASRAKIEIRHPSLVLEGGMDLGQVIASGCGSGAIFSPALLFRPALPKLWQIGLPHVTQLLVRMFADACLQKETGGMHCAAMAQIAGAHDGFFMREDVGRHNAVDKAIGALLLAGGSPSDGILLTSGRIAADMAIKAVSVGIPVVASRSIPTTTAYEIAQRAGITLIGRALSRQPVVYTHAERILAGTMPMSEVEGGRLE